MHKELIRDFGEKELIERLGKFMPKNQISDDCAFVKSKKNDFLINTDALVENVHFNDFTISTIDLGWKAVVSNISDLISSGSIKTIGITISLVLPAETEWCWIEDLYTGINQALAFYGGTIIGGDCSLGNEKVISITALGLQGELHLRRNLCKPGEIILSTGLHGLSKLGLMIKSKNKFNSDVLLTQRLINKSIEHFCRPKLKTNFLKKLLKSRSNEKIIGVGCTDSSDGLFQAIEDLSNASNCKAIIDYDKIIMDRDWPIGEEWDEYYFFGGEDYQFVFSLPKKWAENYLSLDKSVREIGYFVSGEKSVEFKDSKNNKILNLKPFKHF